MCGSDTLTTVVSSTTMKVPSITDDRRRATGGRGRCRSPLAVPSCDVVSVHQRVNTVAVTDMPGRSRCSGSWPGVEHDLHRDALHDLHVVAGGVLRRQQAEARAGRGGDAVDLAGELAAVGVDVDA